jgi:hypothetical protein
MTSAAADATIPPPPPPAMGVNTVAIDWTIQHTGPMSEIINERNGDLGEGWKKGVGSGGVLAL